MDIKYAGQRACNFNLIALLMGVPVGAGGLSHVGRTILLEIAAQQSFSASNKQAWFIYQADLVMATGLSLRTVQRAQKELEQQGFIRVTTGKHLHMANEYHVNVPLLSQLAREQAEKVAEARGAKRQDDVSTCQADVSVRLDDVSKRLDDALPKDHFKDTLKTNTKRTNSTEDQKTSFESVSSTSPRDWVSSSSVSYESLLNQD